jgi:hypothetical protein
MLQLLTRHTSYYFLNISLHIDTSFELLDIIMLHIYTLYDTILYSIYHILYNIYIYICMYVCMYIRRYKVHYTYNAQGNTLGPIPEFSFFPLSFSQRHIISNDLKS